MVISSALIIWKGLICIIGSESPVVVVLSGSMKPGFKRVHEQRDSKEADILTKGDANLYDDRMLYTSSNRWLQQNTSWAELLGKSNTYIFLKVLTSSRSENICKTL
ncbi:signal peptidase complex catalytic subunit SEC11A-like isoform X1 [Gossypium hirsutum]|uniref:Signal peptidase complex catalytic subunit SEC11A-like isoform X1 n=1 Tax=Gossypium hirsutum TaxID=3635 RepID=A0ABM2ZZH9_GOSHI|nr:signal peptidase complex catalytic subunit SEC11A-like isoform X1 [Gossypium hirsutum]